MVEVSIPRKQEQSDVVSVDVFFCTWKNLGYPQPQLMISFPCFYVCFLLFVKHSGLLHFPSCRYTQVQRPLLFQLPPADFDVLELRVPWGLRHTFSISGLLSNCRCCGGLQLLPRNIFKYAASEIFNPVAATPSGYNSHPSSSKEKYRPILAPLQLQLPFTPHQLPPHVQPLIRCTSTVTADKHDHQ